MTEKKYNAPIEFEFEGRTSSKEDLAAAEKQRMEKLHNLARQRKQLGTAPSTEYPIGGKQLGTKLDTDTRHPLTIISESLEKLLSDEES